MTHSLCVCVCVCRGRLVEGHCIIVPSEHVASSRQVDDHIWTELRNFKKCLLQMHMAQVNTAILQIASCWFQRMTVLVCAHPFLGSPQACVTPCLLA